MVNHNAAENRDVRVCTLGFWTFNIVIIIDWVETCLQKTKQKIEKKTPSKIFVAGAHGNKPLKSLHTSLTVNHTYPNYPIGPTLRSTVSPVGFSLKSSFKLQWQKLKLILDETFRHSTQLAHILPPEGQSTLTMTNHTNAKGHRFIPLFPGVPLWALSVSQNWTGPGPPHTDTLWSSQETTVVFVCQWEGL